MPYEEFSVGAVATIALWKLAPSYGSSSSSSTIRYYSRCYSNVRSKADMSQLNLPHGNNNQRVENAELDIKWSGGLGKTAVVAPAVQRPPLQLISIKLCVALHFSD